jgi:hypothetical protein
MMKVNCKKAYLLVILSMTGFSGCVSQPQPEKETLSVQPFIDYYALGGYTGYKEEGLYILAGDIGAVKKGLEEIVLNKPPTKFAFNENEVINIVVFRGVFSTGGYGIKIAKVERVGNAFVVHATYTDPGKGMIATQAFTQPTAKIPLGQLSKGDYKVKLKVTRVLKTEEGDKVLEEEVEHASINFMVK